MKAGLLAGLAYFTVLFGAGTAFGLARMLFVSPHLGVLGGVLMELPVMLAVAWVVCGWLANHLQVGPRVADRNGRHGFRSPDGRRSCPLASVGRQADGRSDDLRRRVGPGAWLRCAGGSMRFSADPRWPIRDAGQPLS
jgi:hypothetical protein